MQDRFELLDDRARFALKPRKCVHYVAVSLPEAHPNDEVWMLAMVGGEVRDERVMSRHDHSTAVAAELVPCRGASRAAARGGGGGRVASSARTPRPGC